MLDSQFEQQLESRQLQTSRGSYGGVLADVRSAVEHERRIDERGV